MKEHSNNELDRKKLNMMKLQIIKLERENLRTADRTRSEMVERIRNIIMTEVNKNY